MKVNYLIAGFLITVSSANTMASSFTNDAQKFVPGGVVVQEKEKEVKVKTTSGSIVEIEFETNGAFEEASGENLEKDILVPAEDLLTLKDAIESLKKVGKTPIGSWSLEKSFLKGWHYEFEGFENGQKMDYLIDAKNGKLLESKIDD